jgi:hypothetical protein
MVQGSIHQAFEAMDFVRFYTATAGPGCFSGRVSDGFGQGSFYLFKMEVLKTAEEGRELWNREWAGGPSYIHEGGGQCGPKRGWGNPVGGLFSKIHHAGWVGW